jgi:hypothetical protein
MQYGTVGIAVSKVKEAAINFPKETRDLLYTLVNDCKGNTAQLDLTKIPEEVIKYFLEHIELSEKQRRTMYLFVTKEQKDILSVPIDTPNEFHNAMCSLGKGGANVEMELNGRWYPIELHSSYQPPNHGCPAYATVNAQITWTGGSYNVSKFIDSRDFTDENGEKRKNTVKGVLEQLGFRPLQTNLLDFVKVVRKAQKVSVDHGRLFNCTNSVVRLSQQWFKSGLDEIQFGSPISPRRVIIESELEIQGSNRYGGYSRFGQQMNTSELPLIRAFSLDMKEYVFIDVRDLEEYVWDEKAIDRLVLPTKIDSILKKVFKADADKLFGDILKGKHGGMIILAHGGPGVGKTLTAEVFAENTKRPLYVMEMGELGTKLADVEQNLQRVFLRATRWNAVLLMDEADVFMAERNENLERSAIVGVFLRLLDYYPGMLFLTTNRRDVIDKAFQSRITLALDYPDLDEEARETVWSTMLGLAGITVTDGLDGIPEIELNGRQIRNLVRLVKVTHGTEIRHSELRDLCEFTCR